MDREDWSEPSKKKSYRREPDSKQGDNIQGGEKFLGVKRSTDRARKKKKKKNESEEHLRIRKTNEVFTGSYGTAQAEKNKKKESIQSANFNRNQKEVQHSGNPRLAKRERGIRAGGGKRKCLRTGQSRGGNKKKGEKLLKGA